MRGDRATGRQGDDGLTAAINAAQVHKLTDSEALALLAYAFGHSRGLNGLELTADDIMCEEHAEITREGFRDGLDATVGAFPAPVDP
jgi:hypothetical protein